jgi:ribosomal protein S18 acetylase RimI-like enzyme
MLMTLSNSSTVLIGVKPPKKDGLPKLPAGRITNRCPNVGLKPQAVILKYTNDEGTITGSVFLEKQERGLYLGMLSVSPLQQATGVGKQLMKAAEQYAKEKWCSFIFMNVISIRHELIKWYERLGYQETSETKPVVVDPRFGVPTQPLEFVIMEKKM